MILSDTELKNQYRLKDLVRYNTRPTLTKETVAEHSYFVVLNCLRLCDILEITGKTKEDILIKGLLHDTPEIDLSDIPHDVKMKSKELTQAYEKMENEYHEENNKDYLYLFDGSDNIIVDLVSELADVYSVRQFCLREKELGNRTLEIEKILEDSTKRIENLEKRVLEYASEQ